MRGTEELRHIPESRWWTKRKVRLERQCECEGCRRDRESRDGQWQQQEASSQKAT